MRNFGVMFELLGMLSLAKLLLPKSGDPGLTLVQKNEVHERSRLFGFNQRTQCSTQLAIGLA